MPIWQTTPPDTPTGNGLPILRTPAGREIQAAVTCHEVLGCPTHYYQGRTIPCEEPDCPPCKEGNPWRWHGWVTAINHQSGHQFLFEFTAQASEPFTQWFKEYGSLRGCLFRAKRLGHRSNSRVHLTTKPLDMTKHPLPDAPNVRKLLSVIWGIPYTEIIEQGTQKHATRIHIERGNGQPSPTDPSFNEQLHGHS